MPIQDDQTLREILESHKTITVLGLSDKPSRASYGVSSYMQEHGYRIIPVNPTVDEVLGEKAYPSLSEVPESVEFVDVFRKPEAVPEVVEEAIRVGAKVLWLQEGVIHEEAAAKAEEAGIQVVMDRCLLKEHARLLGR